MKSRMIIRKLTLAFLFLSLNNAGSLAEKLNYDKEVSLPREIFNFHVVAPNIMRGSQPSKKDLKALKEQCGVRTVLDLRFDPKEIKWEKKIVEKLGMNFISVPMNWNEEQGAEKIEKCLSVMSDWSKQPVFIHCYAGKDRTGLICAAYRIKYDHWSFEDALFEMHVYGYSRDCCFKLEESLSTWNKQRQK